MNCLKAMEIIKLYEKCPSCGSDKLGEGQGGLNVDDDTLTRTCNCGFKITVNENGDVVTSQNNSNLQVNLVKRGKIVHLGAKMKNGQDVYTVSICNGVWDINDSSYAGDIHETTCKRCQKYINEAEENDGVITFKRKRK